MGATPYRLSGSQLTPAMRRRQAAEADAAALRAALPIHQYLFLLHQAAATGFLPTLNAYGRPIPMDQLEPEQRALCFVDAKERIGILSYLVDKQIPAAKPYAIDVGTNGDLLAEQPEQARHVAARTLLDVIRQDDHAQDEIPKLADATRAPDPSVLEPEVLGPTSFERFGIPDDDAPTSPDE